jgi:4-oxalocrotonate tautomerase|tara:strand:+ start:58 stop:237 length:180 start_codon:yes stop_codon:yes gene_type:complete
MAIVTVTLLEGRNQEVKERVIKGITDVLTKELDPNPQHIRVILNEVSRGNYGVGGKSIL